MSPFLQLIFIRLPWLVVFGLLLVGHGSQAQGSVQTNTKVSAQLVPPELGSGTSRVRRLDYTHNALKSRSTGSFIYASTDAPLCIGGGQGPRQARRIRLSARFHANSLVGQGNQAPRQEGTASSVELHNMGQNNPFSARVQLQLSADVGNSPYSEPIAFEINNKTPEQTFVLDLTDYFNAAMLTGQATRLNTSIVSGSYQPGSATYAGNFRLSITLEETYEFAPQPIQIAQHKLNIDRADGLLEQEFSWQAACVTENYQLQLLKLSGTEQKSLSQGTSTEQERAEKKLKEDMGIWRTRAMLLEMQTRDEKWRTTLAEGYGTYYYRIRAIANSPGGISNPENWGEWSAVGKIRLSKPTDQAKVDLSSMNWIYSRTFSEGGRVSEKITYANGLLQSRQTLTRLATNQQVIGLQTLQDYVGRDALQSLPIPLPKEKSLTYYPSLLHHPGTSNVAYGAADFDTDLTATSPAPAAESGYYSGLPQYLTVNPSPGEAPYNEGVADAQQYPFARTLFSRDGTNRVREQGSAGPTLGVGQGRTVRTAYSSVAQQELTALMGDEAPLADKTYKIVTTDPNNVSTITYQTDGKTIATALSGKGGTNLVELPGAAALRTITEKVTDKADFNGIGTVSRKILTLAQQTPVSITYSITPNVLNDECANWCRSCDYQLTVVAYLLDDPTQQKPVYASSEPIKLPASCVAVKQTYPLVNIDLGPGTWVIEKRVTAYTANGANAGSTQLDSQIKELQIEYESFKQESLLWKAIDGILEQPVSTSAGQAQKLKNLYAKLDLLKLPLLGEVGQQYYEVPFGCAPSPTLITIPYLESNCGPVCDGTNPPSFEAMFNERWNGKDGVPSYVLRTVMPSFEVGQFDGMVQRMLADNSDQGYAGKCDELRRIWQGQVESYQLLLDTYQSQDPAQTQLPPLDLEAAFLSAAWDLLPPPRFNPADPTATATPFINIVEQLDARDRYRYVLLDKTNLQHLACLRTILPNANLTKENVSGVLAALSEARRPQVATQFYLCSHNSRLPSPNLPEPKLEDEAKKLSDELQKQCEDRRGEFRQRVIGEFQAQGIKPLPSDCEIDALADDLVRKCRGDATLDTAPSSPDFVTNADGSRVMSVATSKRLQRVMVGEYNLAIKPLGASCESGYELVPVKQLATQPIEISPGAKQVFGYLKQVLAGRTNPNSETISCPGGMGLGEIQPRIFSYSGPVKKDFVNVDKNDLACDNFANSYRENYWLNVVDDQRPINFSTATAAERNRWDKNYVISFPGIISGRSDDAPDQRLISLDAVSGYGCIPQGEDTPGVPKILTNSTVGVKSVDVCAGIKDYTFNILVPVPFNGKYTWSIISKENHYSISDPYLITDDMQFEDYSSSTKGDKNPFSPAGIGFTLTLRYNNSVSYKNCIIQMNNGTYDAFVWKIINDNPCADPRAYQACFQWLDTTPPISIPDGVTPVTLPTCQDLAVNRVAGLIRSQQEQYIADKLAAYRTTYAQQCALPENLQDDLQLEYVLGYHHYTLYYYDRAGNLLKTVPPAGVRLLAANQTAPAHQLVTNYKYNSLGQLVEQTSPDGGTTNFYYNRIGQLRYSLNDKQRAEGKYSYTNYDALGRVVEVGQSDYQYSATLALPRASIEAYTIPETNKAYVTRTTYSTAVAGLTYPAIETESSPTIQRYLTNRVSSTTTSEGARTSYSYDPHGNVEWLAQDVPGLPRKFVRYEYDLISNKVMQVAYQQRQADQFFHRYRYDDDNRLLAVQTSADGQVWEQDAQYSYYPHGPLKRLVLGDDQVQALDYAYTLQGWLKGINHPDLNNSLAAGQAFSKAASDDGRNNGVAADAFGMTLGYYAGDYTRAGSYLSEATPTAASKGVLQPTPQQGLYNGNIATWTTRSLENTAANPTGSSPTAGEVYRYDQLNRLLQSTRSTAAGISGWASSEQYATSYRYDANGNLQNLTRTANSAALIDNLTYKYKRATDGSLLSNRLLAVKDEVADNVSGEDVDSQISSEDPHPPKMLPRLNNYAYDRVGNLIRDFQSGVSSISWTPYGKIAQVVRPGINQTSYLYDAQGNRIRKELTPTNGAVANTYYVRDAQGNVLALYEQVPGQPVTLVEQPLYGSARLGQRKPAGPPLTTAPPTPGITGATYARVLGQKLYELSDHLGNVRAVVTDEKTSTLSASTGLPLASSLKPVLSAYYNYYAFGQLQPGRYSSGSTGAGGYRYGYNGKEKDNNGELGLTNYDYGFRIYNPGIARWLSTDPLEKKYANFSPYNSFDNNPIYFQDRDGQDADIAVKGNTITISTVIHIIGSSATKAKANEMQKQIMSIWGKDFKYKEGNKEYNVKFNITVTNAPLSMSEKAAMALDVNTHNVVVLGTQYPGPLAQRSSVNGNGKMGFWASKFPRDENPYPHETGHLLGFDDAYYEGEYDSSKGNLGGEKVFGNYNSTPITELMGTNPFKGEVSPRMINEIAKYSLNHVDKKTGLGRIDATGSPILKPSKADKEFLTNDGIILKNPTL